MLTLNMTSNDRFELTRAKDSGRQCEVANGRFVEFRFTKIKSSRIAALEKTE